MKVDIHYIDHLLYATPYTVYVLKPLGRGILSNPSRNIYNKGYSFLRFVDHNYIAIPL